MPQVTILVGGKPTTVNETSPGLFGQLGYEYVSGGPSTPESAPEPGVIGRGDDFGTPATVEDIQQDFPGTTVQQPGGVVDASQVGGETSLVVPDVTGESPDLSAAQGLLAGKTVELEAFEKETEAARKKFEDAQATSQQQTKTFLDRFLKEDTPSELRTTLQEEADFKPGEFFAKRKADIAEIDSLMTTYNKAVEARDLALSAELERGRQGIPGGIITARMRQMERDANIRLNTMSAHIKTKLGIMEMRDQNFELAQSYINQAVQEYTAAQRFKVEQFQLFHSLNREVINDLGDKYKLLFNATFQLARDELEFQRDNLNSKFNVIVQNPEVAWPSDISSLSLEEVVIMAGNKPVAPGTFPTGTPTSFKEYEIAGGLQGTGLTFQQWLDRNRGDTDLTLGQQINFDKKLINDVSNEKGAFFAALRTQSSIEDLASLAISQGVSFEGFKQALLAKSDIVIDSAGDVFDTKPLSPDTKLGNINDVEEKFGAQTILDLDAILFSEDEEF